MLNAKGFKHWKVSLVVVSALLTGLILAACVPADLTTNVARTSSDVAALKGEIAAIKKAVDEIEKGGMEPKGIERETKDQTIRGRADLLDYRMDYDAFKSAIMGTPAKKGQQGKPDIPAKPGLVASELSKLQSALVGTPAKKGTQGKPDTPAKPGLLPSRGDVEAVSKALADIKSQLDRIERSLGGAPPPPAKAPEAKPPAKAPEAKPPAQAPAEKPPAQAPAAKPTAE